MGALKRFVKSKCSKVNRLVDHVNEANSQRRDNRSIPRMIDTSVSRGSPTKLTITNALRASLSADLTKANRPPQSSRDWVRGLRRDGDRDSRGGDGCQEGRNTE